MGLASVVVVAVDVVIVVMVSKALSSFFRFIVAISLLRSYNHLRRIALQILYSLVVVVENLSLFTLYS